MVQESEHIACMYETLSLLPDYMIPQGPLGIVLALPFTIKYALQNST